jgi:hypothetical protein
MDHSSNYVNIYQWYYDRTVRADVTLRMASQEELTPVMVLTEIKECSNKLHQLWCEYNMILSRCFDSLAKEDQARSLNPRGMYGSLWFQPNICLYWVCLYRKTIMSACRAWEPRHQLSQDYYTNRFSLFTDKAPGQLSAENDEPNIEDRGLLQLNSLIIVADLATRCELF